MFNRSTVVLLSLSSLTLAGIRSGHAEADWITSSSTYSVGIPVQTAIRLKIDPKWHTYWSNPGEGGMKMSVTWELPEGWQAGALEYPTPMRFMTGELPGFGYEGTVIFPVEFNPPAGASGTVKLKGSASWLTCNDDKCVPGDANFELVLTAGNAQPTSEASLIEIARRKIPQPAHGYSLAIVENEKTLKLTINLPADLKIKMADFECFPATAQVIDSAAKFDFVQSGTAWTAEVPKSEYITSPIPPVTLVFASKNHLPSWAVSTIPK